MTRYLQIVATVAEKDLGSIVFDIQKRAKSLEVHAITELNGTSKREAVLNYLKANGTANRKEIAKSLNLTMQAVSGHLGTLLKSKLVKSAGYGKWSAT